MGGLQLLGMWHEAERKKSKGRMFANLLLRSIGDVQDFDELDVIFERERPEPSTEASVALTT
jgi:hypothetical protein